MHSIYFARHGQTFWNVEGKICGVTDIPLTEEGLRQAKRLGETVKNGNYPIDRILCSPLCRAADTARCVAEITGLPLSADERLREQCFGRFEGTARHGEEFMAAKQNMADRYSGGESMLQLTHRVYSLLDELREQNDTVLLVAHNGIARAVHSYFYDMTNEEFAAFGIKNCAVVRYDFT